MIEGMAAVVQRGIDELLSLRESNKQLLETCKFALHALGDMTTEEFSLGGDKLARTRLQEAIRKAEEHINRDIDHEESLDHQQTISDARHAGCP